MGHSTCGRRNRRMRLVLVLAGAGLVVAGFALCILLTHGVEGVVRFLTVPTLKAKSGKQYTPQGAVKRYLEKLEEKERSAE